MQSLTGDALPLPTRLARCLTMCAVLLASHTAAPAAPLSSPQREDSGALNEYVELDLAPQASEDDLEKLADAEGAP